MFTTLLYSSKSLPSRKFRLALVLLPLLAIVSVNSASTESIEEKGKSARVKIGVSTTLTGPAATYGDDIRRVVAFANEKIGGDRFEIILEDDKCNGKDAVTVAKKLVEVDKVQGVIGFGCSGALLAAAPIYDRAKIPVIGTLTSAAKISEAGKYIFRTQPSDGDGVKLLYRYLKSRHKRFGLVSQETEFAQGLAKGLLTESENDKSLEIINESFLNLDSDLSPQLLRMKSKQIDGLFLNGQDEGVIYQLLKRSRELKINVPFYTFYLGASSAFLELAKADAEGVISVDAPSFTDISNADSQQLYAEFVEKHGKLNAWDYGFSTTFDGFRALSQALLSKKNPAEYLGETKFQGTFGPYSFDSNGDIIGLTLTLKQIRNGRPVVIPPEKFDTPVSKAN